MTIFGGSNHMKIQYQREWHDWAQSENIVSMREAIDEGQDVNEIVLNGLTAGSIAGLGGRLILLEFLRDQNADLSKLDGNDMSTLMCSAHSGTVKIAAKLLAKGNPEELLSHKNSQGMTALHFAAKSGRAEMIQLLITKKADPNMPDIDGNTPLHYSMLGGSPLAVTTLVRGGATEVENAKGQKPSQFKGAQPACRKVLQDGYAEGFGGAHGSSASMLGGFGSISSSSSISASSSMSSMGSASSTMDFDEKIEETIEILEEEKNKKGNSNFLATTPTVHDKITTEMRQHLEKDEACELLDKAHELIKMGVNPLTATDNNGNTLLHWAPTLDIDQAMWTVSELADAIESVCPFKINIAEIKNNDGKTPYSYVIETDQVDAFLFLLSKQENPDANLAEKLTQECVIHSASKIQVAITNSLPKSKAQNRHHM